MSNEEPAGGKFYTEELENSENREEETDVHSKRRVRRASISQDAVNGPLDHIWITAAELRQSIEGMMADFDEL